MGPVNWGRAGVASLLLLISLVLADFIDAQTTPLEYPVSLQSSRLVTSPWRSGRDIPIEDKIVRSLELDDYLYRQFANADEQINLYIGFYHSAEKIGAAHNPLVCFQGQGWVTSERHNGVVDVPGHKVNYSSMIAANGQQKEYVFYWFQSFDQTGFSTFQQKLKMIHNKLTGLGTSNAFVRITTTVGNGTVQGAHERSVAFVKAFYPAFYAYVTQVE